MPFAYLILGLMLLYLEFFLTGWVLGILGFGGIITSIVLAFVSYASPIASYTFLAMACIFTYITCKVALYRLRASGKSNTFVLSKDSASSIAPTADPRLIGKFGVTQTQMVLSGKVKVDGKVFDAIASRPIPSGANVKITKVHGNSYHVDPIDVSPSPKSKNRKNTK